MLKLENSIRGLSFSRVAFDLTIQGVKTCIYIMIEKVVVIMKYMKAFIQSESSGGIMLLLAAILGVITANSPIAEKYFSMMHIYLGPMDVLEWVNDGLMALFFLYVGIEIKT